jgi:hypothetical protein
MKMPRLFDALMEAPLGDYSMLGDFSQGTRSDSFSHPLDRQRVSQGEPRLRKMMGGSPYHFNIYFYNFSADQISSLIGLPVQNEQDWTEAYEQLNGEYTSQSIRQKFGLTVTSDPKAITFLLGGNPEGEGVGRLTPWMMVHKFVHAVEHGVAFFRPDQVSKEVGQAYRNFEDVVDPKLSAKSGAKRRAQYDAHYNNLISQGTMRSAKNNSFLVPEEIGTEYLTQYFVKGAITLKTDKALEATLNQSAKRLFDVCVGRIFVCF